MFAYIMSRYWPHIAIVVISATIVATIAYAVGAAAGDRRAAKAELALVHAQRDAAQQARLADTRLADLTEQARADNDAQLAEHQPRAARVEAIAHAPRQPVPPVCPDPDPDLLRELEAGRGRVSAAEDRLRGLRRAGDGDPG